MTGGNQRLGQAFALALARAGARVALPGRRPPDARARIALDRQHRQHVRSANHSSAGHWIEDAPQQRAALPAEIAPSVVFLASDAASFITGSVLVADGGYTAV